MKVNIIRPGELGPGEISSWHLMQKATPAFADPFLSPEYAIAAGRLRQQSRVAVLLDGEAIVGFFPFEARQFGTAVPISGWLSACQGVVHVPEVHVNMRSLLRQCGLSAWHFDNLIAVQAAGEGFNADMAPASVIDLAGGYDAYYTRLRERDAHFCREIERKARKLSREVGDVRLERNSRNPDMLSLLMRWKSDQYRHTDHVDRFARPWVTTLLHALLTEQSGHLAGLLSVLYAGDKPVAIQFGLRSGGMLSGWFTGYDGAAGKYSPGIIQLKMMTEELAGIGVDTLQMGKGAKSSVRNFKTADIQLGSGTATANSPLGLTHHFLGGVSRQALRTLRRHPALHRTADRIVRGSGVSSRLYGKV